MYSTVVYSGNDFLIYQGSQKYLIYSMIMCSVDIRWFAKRVLNAAGSDSKGLFQDRDCRCRFSLLATLSPFPSSGLHRTHWLLFP